MLVRIEGTYWNHITKIPTEVFDVCNAIHEFGSNGEVNLDVKGSIIVGEFQQLLDRSIPADSHFVRDMRDGILVFRQRLRPTQPTTYEEVVHTTTPVRIIDIEDEDEDEDEDRFELVARAPAHPLRTVDYDHINENLALNEETLPRHLYSAKSALNISKVNSMDTLLAEYNSLISKMIEIKRKIDSINVDISKDEDVDIVMNQIAELRSGMPRNKLEKVFVTKQNIVIQTRSIIANGEDAKRYNIGRLQFIVPLNTMLGLRPIASAVYVHNIDYVIKDNENESYYFAPHTYNNGVCFGNATELIVEALAKKDLQALCDVLIRFYENPNMADAMGQIVTTFNEEVTESV